MPLLTRKVEMAYIAGNAIAFGLLVIPLPATEMVFILSLLPTQ